MSKYRVRFFSGDYYHRQLAANEWWRRERKTNLNIRACYFEQHFNSTVRPEVNYTLAVTAVNASETSKRWGRLYAEYAGTYFKIKMGGVDGILVGGYKGRGNANLILTEMPAIIGEPLFVSNPAGAGIVKSPDGQAALARILVNTIEKIWPQGALVCLSIGHKGKRSNPNDRGAEVYGGGYEADYAELVLIQARSILESII